MERNRKIDLIRAFAIITVIIGHSIQFGSGSAYYSGKCLEDPVFKFIYSFHMPLFMLLSGYLFYQTLNRHSFSKNIQSRFTTLFVPIIMWNIVPFIMYTWHDRPHTFRYLFKTYLSTMIDNSWFLWAIFYCSFAILIVNRFFKDNIIVYLIGLILTFVIPDSHNLSLYKFMYPFFLIGYFYHKHSEKIKEKYRPFLESWKLLGSVTVIFILLLYFFNNNSYIYTTGYTLLNKDIFSQLGIDIYRFLIGFFGSSFVIMLLLKIYPKMNDCSINVLSIVGINSLGIYMISGLIFQYLLPGLTVGITNVNYLFVILETIAIIIISLLVSLCISKFSVTNMLFFGGRKYKR